MTLNNIPKKLKLTDCSNNKGKYMHLNLQQNLGG